MDSISSKKIAKNTILNFIGQGIPLLVLIFTMPFIIKGLGTIQFGFISIVWVIIGNFAVFDLGLGRAINKFVSEAISKGNKSEVPQIIWTAVTVQLVFGVIGGVIFALITPFLVEHLLKIPANLTQEALISLYLLVPSIPIILITASLSGVLSAYQRFDIINAVKIPVSSLTYILLLICVLLKFNLPEIVTVILFIRVLNLIIFAIFNFRIIPGLKRFSISSGIMPRLFSYGGWVTVSNVVGPILVYLDRLLIGIILSMSAVAYYSVPYEAVTRLWIIPTSLTMVLFPSFSSLDGIGDKKKIDGLFAHSVKYIILGFGVLCLFVILFAKNILGVWVGNNFALKSVLPMQILVLGVFINSVGHIPYTLLQAVGRPDITAKFHL
ncbi:MAG: flippase, partial [bacterium]